MVPDVALETNLSLALRATLTGTAGIGQPVQPLNAARLLALANGTGAGQADRLWAPAPRTLAASASEDHDLSGVLTDAFGAALSFARIKMIYVAASATNTNNVVIGADATAPWATLLNTTGTLTLRPGAFVLAGVGSADATGYVVTATTADILQVANSAGGTSVTYEIAIIGASA